MDDAYFMQSARSGAFLGAFAMILVVETGALHLLLAARWPLVAWFLTASSVSLLLWLVADYAALGRSAVHLDADHLVARIGRRALLTVPLARIAGISQIGWRDVPERRQGYLNATKPATPNVLLSFREPVDIQILGMRRQIDRLGLHLDQPAAFVEAWARRTSVTQN